MHFKEWQRQLLIREGPQQCSQSRKTHKYHTALNKQPVLPIRRSAQHEHTRHMELRHITAQCTLASYGQGSVLLVVLLLLCMPLSQML
jgi:hypothetical protein